MPNRKDYIDKLDWGLLPLDLLDDVVRVLEYGKKKYGKNNWREPIKDPLLYVSALIRHLVAYSKGEKLDKESGISHTAHMVANILILENYDRTE